MLDQLVGSDNPGRLCPGVAPGEDAGCHLGDRTMAMTMTTTTTGAPPSGRGSSPGRGN